MRKLILLAVLALAAAPALAAMVEIDRTVPIGPDGAVGLSIIAGTVEIQGGDGSDVRIHVSYDDRHLEVRIDETSRGVSIEIAPPEDDREHVRGRDLEGTTVRLDVPRGARIEIESVSAETTIAGIDGDLEVETVSGAVDIRGGNPRVSVSSVSGDVRVSADGGLRGGDFESVSAKILFAGPLGPGARLSFESVSGDVDLRLPSGVSAEFEIETFSGEIENELGPPARSSSEFLPSKELHFKLGSGDARISAETLSGRITLAGN